MEPYKASKMPLEYKIDKEMLRLISDANVKYGEYKTLLNTLEFDAGYCKCCEQLSSWRRWCGWCAS